MVAGQPTRPGLEGVRVLLGISGGIAAYRAAELARLLVHAGAEVQPVPTANATRLVGSATFAALTGRAVPGSLWSDPAAVEHVRLARWADVVVIAPATAHLLARVALGLADDLLTSTALAFPGPLVLAPAMHTEMWEHPATRDNVERLTGRGAVVVPPGTGPLTSGDTGVGRLAEPQDILSAVVTATTAARPGPLARRRVLITLGGTREPLDPVRFLGNRSSGRMGAALVAEALRRGAVVTAVAGATTVPVPPRARVLPIETAQQLHDVVLAEAPAQDVLMLAAAVADFRPKKASPVKLKKEEGIPELALEPTPDALAELGRVRRGDQVLVGFAAETTDHLAAGERKRVAKGADLIVLNHVEGPGSAFGAASARAYLIGPGGMLPLGTADKEEIAARVLDAVVELLTERGLLAPAWGHG